MNKLELGYLGGDPDTNDAVEFMADGFAEAINGLASFFQSGNSDPVIISGLESHTAGSFVIYTDGFIVVNSEVYAVTGGSFTVGDSLAIDITPYFDPAGDEVFENLVPQQTFQVRRGSLQVTAGTGLEIDITTFLTLKSRLSDLGALIDLSTPLTTCLLAGSWLHEPTEEPAKSRLNKLGDVEMYGYVKNANVSGANGGIITTLPPSQRPNFAKTFVVSAMVNSVFVAARIRIDTAGVVRYIGASGDLVTFLCLNQIKFPRNT